MSNEELAAAIQAGNEELYLELWEQVKRFVAQQAIRRYYVTGGFGGVEVEDLIQSGYLALVAAVGYFDPAGEYKFLTVLGNCLKTAFTRAGGYGTRKRDPLNGCMSLDTPLGDDPKGDTWLDMLEDPCDAYEAADERLWREELRAALDTALSKLPAEEAETLISRYYQEKTYEEIGASSGTTPGKVRSREYSGLQRLRRPSAGLIRFVDERTDFYTSVGVAAFHRTHTSAVEMLAIKREDMAARFA